MNKVRPVLLVLIWLGAVLSAAPAAHAQRVGPSSTLGGLSICGVFVSDSNVFVGESITVEGHGFDTGTAVTFLIGGVPFGTDTADGAGVASTTYSFSSAGTFDFQAAGTSAEIPCTTASVFVSSSSPTTTTSTTVPERDVAVSCDVSVDFPPDWESDGEVWVVTPEMVLVVTGSGFDGSVGAQDVVVQSPTALEEIASVAVEPDGSFTAEVEIPDWPAAEYLVVVHQPGSTREFCSGFFRVRVDLPEAPAGDCSIVVWEVLARDHIPYFMWGEYVTTGKGFEPGEMVVLTLLNSPDVEPGEAVSGPFGPIGDEGTFEMPFAPPNNEFETGDAPPVWEARTQSCTAHYVFGSVEADSEDSPQFEVPPDFFDFGGFQPSSGECSLMVWKATAVTKDIVEEPYQPNAADYNFVNAYGADYGPGEFVSWFIDGKPFQVTQGQDVFTDGSGRFRVSGAGALNPIASEPTPYLLTAQTESCAASAVYGASAIGETDAPGAEPSPNGTNPSELTEAAPGDGGGVSNEMIALVGLGLGGMLGGFVLSNTARNRRKVRRGPDDPEPGDSP